MWISFFDFFCSSKHLKGGSRERVSSSVLSVKLFESEVGMPLRRALGKTRLKDADFIVAQNLFNVHEIQAT